MFFRLSMIHENLESYYKTNFSLINDYKYSLEDIGNLIPWEREIIIALIKQRIEEEELRNNNG